jgi:hypothetical protein
VIDIILYIIFTLCYPKRKDFIRMGLGIKARYERNKTYWQQHGTLTKQYTQQHIPQTAQSFLVLGSGRLYDFPIEAMPADANVTLVDADPLALWLAGWKLRIWSMRHQKNLTLKIILQDVTGAIDYFAAHQELPPDPNPLADIARHDVVISLNLLGQLPLYFFNRAELFQKALTDNELLSLACSLQEQHIEQVIQRARQRAIFIYDREFYFYTSDISEWEVSRATHEEIFDRYEEMRCSCATWFWHISPEAVEGEGVLHRIGARAYSK